MKKLLYTLLAVLFIFSACKKEDEEPTNTGNNNNNTGNTTATIIGSWNVVSMAYDITEGVYTSGSYPNGSFTVTNLNSGISNYALVNARLTHQFSSDGLFTQIYNNDISNNQADTSYGSFVIVEDSIFLSSGQKGTILVTQTTLLMDLFHINLDYPDFESFQFNHTSERE